MALFVKLFWLCFLLETRTSAATRFVGLHSPNRLQAVDRLVESCSGFQRLGCWKVASSITQPYNEFGLQNVSVLPSRGRNGFDGITGRKMRAEDHGLAKNMELKLTADQPLALAA